MIREDFMDIVYSELESDPDNNRANRIIWAADGYAERRVDDALQVIEELQSAQLGTNLAEVGTDTISRQAAIDALCSICGDDCDKSEFIYNAPQDEQVIMCPEHYVLSTLPPTHPDNQVHLCDSCSYTYPECPSVYTDMIFGNGIGNDNICACSKYLPSAQPEIIHCKDCKYYDPIYTGGAGVCGHWNAKTENNAYCSYRKRRTDG